MSISDDDFDDPSFLLDDDALAQIDSLAAPPPPPPHPHSRPPPTGLGLAPRPHSTSLQLAQPHRSLALNQQRPSASSSVSRVLQPNALAGPSRPKSHQAAAAIEINDSSDEFDEFDIPAESLSIIDRFTSRTHLPDTASRSNSLGSFITRPAGPRINGRPANPAPTPNAALTTGGAYQLPQYTALQTSHQSHLPFRPAQPKPGKKWDRTAFAATGKGKGKAKAGAKGRGRGGKKRRDVWGCLDSDEEDEDEEEVEFEQFPRPFVDPNAPPPPPRHTPLSSLIPTYLYPTNFPLRTYQYEIVRACFLDNTLVALPTGLGKTFVAGVVLLNFYRWFPSGKLVFLMPTKPLVTQQHEACHESCGIPAADTATITGDDPEGWRENTWKSKRVIYATPQTFLSDLARKRVDPFDIVLVIIDEAHKASGNHSYVQCISYLKSFHPHFRIVGLTATPGRTPERVQGVVDALHISRVEIREAEAPEIQKYMFKKQIYPHVIQIDGELADIRDRWAKLMKVSPPLVQRLVGAEMLTPRALDILRLKAFTVTVLNQRAQVPGNLRPTIGQLSSMAIAMQYLLEFSLGMFHKQLLSLTGDSRGSKGKPGKASKSGLAANSEFKKIIDDVERLMGNPSKAERHPKLTEVRDLLVQHLAADTINLQEGQVTKPTKCMVFCSFRGAVGEIVEVLNEHQPLIKAHKFVGKATAAKNDEDKGLSQAEQKNVIDKFRRGDYNVLVATSIGEEGLDIGEVDFIIVYNCPTESIKMLQRIGRAGRKRDGHIHVLMTEGREDGNWDSANVEHREIQEEIIHGRNIELFDDVEPMLPNGIPKVVMQHMEIEPFVPEEKRNSKRKRAAGKRASPKPKRQRGIEVPENATQGFVFASNLVTKGGKKKAAPRKRQAALANSDDDMDMSVSGDNRAVDSDVQMTGARPVKAKLRKSGKVKTKQPSSARNKSSPEEQRAAKHQAGEKFFQELEHEGQRKRARYPLADQDEEEDDDYNLQGGGIDFFNAAVSGSSRRRQSPLFDEEASGGGSDSGMSSVKLSGPLGARKAVQKLPAGLAALAGFSDIDPDMSWMLNDDDDDEAPLPPSRPTTAPFKIPSMTSTYRSGMGPPRGLSSRSAPSPLVDPSPLPQRRGHARRVVPSSSEGGGDNSPLPAPRRRLVPRPDPDNVPNGRHFIETEVAVSDHNSASDEDYDSSGEENESDRQFAGDFQPTQAPGYDQHRAYIAGLATQAPKGGPAFADRSNKYADFKAKARRPVLLSQEDTRAGPSSEYDGSFVCGDDTIEYDTD